MTLQQQLFVLGILNLISLGASLKCYNCVHFECPHLDQDSCNEMEEAALAVAGLWFEKAPTERATLCPEPDDVGKWEMLEKPEYSQCSRNSQACAMMRFEVRTFTLDMKRASPVVSYGTIIGCDTKDRSRLFPTVYASKLPCLCVFEVKSYKKELNSPHIHRVFYENCAGHHCNSTASSTCFSDFCTNKEAVLPKRFVFQDVETSTRSWAILMLVFIIIIITVLCIEDLHLIYVPAVGISKFYYDNAKNLPTD